MSAPAIEKLMSTGEHNTNNESVSGAATTLGRAATSLEAAPEATGYESIDHDNAEAFFADFLDDQLEPETTGFSVTPENATVRLSRLSAAEELVHIEFTEEDEQLGATGVLVYAQKIDSGDPWHREGNAAVVKAAKTSRNAEGVLAVDKLDSNTYSWRYAIGKTAESIAEEAALAKGDYGDQVKSYELAGALRQRHGEVTI